MKKSWILFLFRILIFSMGLSLYFWKTNLALLAQSNSTFSEDFSQSQDPVQFVDNMYQWYLNQKKKPTKRLTESSEKWRSKISVADYFWMEALLETQSEHFTPEIWKLVQMNYEHYLNQFTMHFKIASPCNLFAYAPGGFENYYIRSAEQKKDIAYVFVRTLFNNSSYDIIWYLTRLNSTSPWKVVDIYYQAQNRETRDYDCQPQLSESLGWLSNIIQKDLRQDSSFQKSIPSKHVNLDLKIPVFKFAYHFDDFQNLSHPAGMALFFYQWYNHIGHHTSHFFEDSLYYSKHARILLTSELYDLLKREIKLPPHDLTVDDLSFNPFTFSQKDMPYVRIKNWLLIDGSAAHVNIEVDSAPDFPEPIALKVILKSHATGFNEKKKNLPSWQIADVIREDASLLKILQRAVTQKLVPRS